MKQIILSVALALCGIACSNNEKTSTIAADSLGKDSVMSVAPQYDESYKHFAFIVDDTFLVLSAEPDSLWTQGVPSSYGQFGMGYYSLAAVDTSKLPEAYKTAKNMQFTVYSATGTRSTAHVVGFSILSAETPHFGTVQQWKGEQGEPTMSDSEIAASLWESGQHFLVAKLELDEPSGDGFVFAVPGSNTSVDFFDEITIETDAVVQALSNSQEYANLQSDYEHSTEDTTRWWTTDAVSSMLTSYKGKKNNEFTVVSETSGEMCGGPYYFSLTSIWGYENGVPQSLYFNTENDYEVVCVFDIDGDDVPEFLLKTAFGELVVISGSEGWSMMSQLKIPYHDCPC